jgi:microcystin-dependent protein
VGQPMVGEIRMFAGSFAPAGWAFCNGAVVPISENETLFNLIGTTYGGDGQETFALPDLQGRASMHAGTGPGLSQTYVLGEKAGVESVTVSTQQLPVHSHPMVASTNPGIESSTQGNIVCSSPSINLYIEGQGPDTNLNTQVASIVGGSQPHENLQQYLCISFIISLFGVFPRPG